LATIDFAERSEAKSIKGDSALATKIIHSQSVTIGRKAVSELP
jgi:hypothetical protein